MIGQIISHYKILEKLGEGGMGIVYKVQDTKLDRLLALKFLPPHLTVKDTDKARFLQEAKAASAINHPNVCIIHDIQEHEERQFLVMEYVDGQTLRAHIDSIANRQLPTANCLDYALQIAASLEAAHAKGVVHRDIKSENIMVSLTNQIKVMDFGLAKLKGSLKLTKTSSTVGTLAYMAPEQIEGKATDARSDIFSFGVVLYEMLTGKLPFHGEYESSLMYAILNDQPDPIQKVRTDISSEMMHVLNRTLEKSPNDRYQTVNEILIDLKRIKRDSDQVSRKDISDIPVTKTRTFDKISVKKLAIYSTAIITLVVAALWIFNRFTDEEPLQSMTVNERSIAIMYFENISGDESLDHWRKSITNMIITDLYQSKYVKVVDDERLFGILSRLNKLDATSYTTGTLREVAAQARAKYVTTGKYTKAGELFRINITLHDITSPDKNRVYTIDGAGIESQFDMVDSLSNWLKSCINLSAQEFASDFDKSVADITTKSPEAYVFYNKGREYKAARDYDRAIFNLEEAIKIDSTFAMAYKIIADIYYEKDLWLMSEKYTRKVMEFKNRLSDRERYLIEGNFFRSQGEYDKAIDAYEYVLKIFPQDFDAHMSLGYSHDNIDKSIEYYNVCVQNEPDNFEALYWLCASYLFKGSYEKMIELLKEYQSKYGDRDGIHELFSWMYKEKQEFDLALKEIEIAESLNPQNFENVFEKGRIHVAMKNFTEAEKSFEKALNWKFPTAQLWARQELADLYLSQGRIEKMKNQANAGIILTEELGEKFWKVSFLGKLVFGYTLLGDYAELLILADKLSETTSDSRNIETRSFALHWITTIFIKMKSIKKARIEAEKLKEFEGFNGYYNYLVGEIELESGNPKKAIKFFKLGLSADVPEWLKPIIPYSLGFAYYKTGDLGKAEEEYKKIIAYKNLSDPRLVGYMFTKKHYMLGKIYQDLGLKEQAIEQYSKFLEILKDADYDFPELIDGKKQLNKLKEMSGI
jgi:serine/threonine protein kinase